MNAGQIQGSRLGIVAILDALGASRFNEPEIHHFVNARSAVIGKLQQKAEEVLAGIEAAQIKTFTFNDTILVTCDSNNGAPSLEQVTSFLLVIRKFMVDSLDQRILFRGAISTGMFYANDATNTVLGEAVSDAAAWYDKADWIGVHCTPKCSLVLDSLLATEENKRNYVALDYEVPLSSGIQLKAKAINWPRVFFIPSLNPWQGDAQPKAKLLELLARHSVPFGTESKYTNTVAFFEYSSKQYNADRRGPARASSVG